MLSTNDGPLASVILPVYNGAEFLASALESVLCQTYRNIEIIAVDDGSTDATRAILDAYAARDFRIRVIGQANAGVARARNRAIEQARGEYIAPIDADDLWAPEKIERQMQRMLTAGDDTGLVYSWWAWIDCDGVILDRSPRWTIEGNVLEELICINFTGNASVPLFRRRCLQEIGGYNEELAAARAGGCEDWEVALRVAERYRVAVVPEILLGYRRRPGNMSSACQTMWRSQQHVIQAIRQLRPDLKPALFRRSANQFAMYLAGISFWSGNFIRALRWGLRAGPRLAILVSPWVARMTLGRRSRNENPHLMAPGAALDTSRIAEPLLPYDRIVTARLPSWAMRGVLTVATICLSASRAIAARGVHRVLRSILLTRMKLEYFISRLPSRSRKPRVLAIACWHFPIYSQTFVYREILQLASKGFDVRFAYAGLTSRRGLPDDCSSLWGLKRRLLLAESTATLDLEHYKSRMPAQVTQLAQVISAASGLSEDQVFAHQHFRYAFSFTRFAEAWKPDYIHTYFFYEATLFGFVASSLLGIPRGVSCYADHMLDDYDLKLVPVHMEDCEVVVATSARIRNELEAIARQPLSAAIVKPNGIDATQFSQTQRLLEGAGRAFRIIAVNRIHRKKGIMQLIEAALLLHKQGAAFLVEILGEHDAHDTDSRAYYEELKNFVAAHNLGGRVTFRGRQTAAQVRGHLEQCDIFVAPFVELPNGDKDGIPTALLEAMAAGCAIVSTDAGSIIEVIDDQVEAIIVPQYDPVALANALSRLMQDEALRSSLSRAAVDRVRKQFDVSQCEPIFHQKVRAAIASRQHSRQTDLAR